MKKYILTLLVLLTFSAVFAENKAPRRPNKQKFDWKKAEGEREKMREKFRSEHKKQLEELKKFKKRYAEAEDEEAKNAVKKELQEFLNKDFQNKIELSKKRLEEMKKYVARLESECKRMEENASDIVNKRTEEVLKGKISRKRPQ